MFPFTLNFPISVAGFFGKIVILEVYLSKVMKLGREV
jgi:hypothetical protein